MRMLRRFAIGAMVASIAFCLEVRPPGDAHTVRRPRLHPGASHAFAQRRPRSRRRSRRVRRRRRRGTSHRDRRRQWHTRASVSVRRAWMALEPRPLVLRSVWQNQTYRLVPAGEPLFDFVGLRFARKALASRVDGSHREVHPRLLELVYRAVLHFEVPYVHVISGYRPDRATSRHTQGRAMDIVLPGVSDRRLARYFRRQGFVGVGLYPTSGFVHIDVRARSNFWIDRSGPGQPDRRRAMLAAQARRSDRAAAARGEQVVPDVVSDDEPTTKVRNSNLPNLIPPSARTPGQMGPDSSERATSDQRAPSGD